jgi:hypothetical protein
MNNLEKEREGGKRSKPRSACNHGHVLLRNTAEQLTGITLLP